MQNDYTDEELQSMQDEELKRYLLGNGPFPLSMGKEAFYGIAGDVVNAILPHSEASAEALLVQFLVAFGNMIGYLPVCHQAAPHRLNEFVVLVGDTATSRKGTSWRAIESFLGAIDPQWTSDRVRDGCQSSESIIHLIRDPSTRKGPGGRPVNDPGVADKRLLLFEEEFARLLVVSARPGSTISPVMRKLWDGTHRIHVESKTAAECATDPHVSVIAHCTRLEILRILSESENTNGFSNRFLWTATRRSKDLSHPRGINWRKDCAGIIKSIAQVYSLVSDPFEMSWTPKGAKAWDDFYRSCNQNRCNGIVGSIMGRAEAHTLRLAMIYAALDGTKLIDQFHLEAAAAVWDYCVKSILWCFGDKTGNSKADKLLWELRRNPQGIKRTEIYHDVFNCNISSTDLNIALSELVTADLVFMRLERTQTPRRLAERWFSKT
jgi:hypothetical protein